MLNLCMKKLIKYFFKHTKALKYFLILFFTPPTPQATHVHSKHYRCPTPVNIQMWNKVLTNINYVVQSTHSHPIPHIPPAPPSYNSPKHSQDKRMQATKRCSKTTPDKYNYNDTLHTQLNIGSVNICGALWSKTAYINNKFLQKTTHQFHILALLETKTSIEDSTWLKNAFPGYSVFVTGESKNKLWKDYRESEENKALKYRSNTLIDKQLISINEQKCQTLGGVVLLIRILILQGGT